MNKEEVEVFLKNNGYKVIFDMGVPVVVIDNMDIDKVHKEVGKLLKSVGYKSSYGVRGKRLEES